MAARRSGDGVVAGAVGVGSRRSGSGSSTRTILSAAISSKPMLSGLRATELTCGGTMWPRPSPSWLKYELIWRARRAASVTRLNLESTRVEQLLDRRVHHRVVDASHQFSLLKRLCQCTATEAELGGHRASERRWSIDDRQHLVDRAVEVVVDDDVVGQRQPDRLLVERLAQPLGRPCPRGRRGRAAGAAAPRVTAAARRSAPPRGAAASPAGAVDLDLEHDVAAVVGLRASGCRSSCRGTRSTPGSRRASMRCSNVGAVGEDVRVVGARRVVAHGSSTTGSATARGRARPGR